METKKIKGSREHVPPLGGAHQSFHPSQGTDECLHYDPVEERLAWLPTVTETSLRESQTVFVVAINLRNPYDGFPA